jgi:hypothetical protein
MICFNIKSITQAALLSGLFFSCSHCYDSRTSGGLLSQKPETPAWLSTKIQEFKSEDASKVPNFVNSYQYNNQLVYYIPAPACCDQFSSLYDPAGNVICHPDGGITGKGDMKCTDFVQKRTDEKIIWKDDRVN